MILTTYVATSEAFFFRRYTHNSNAISEPPGSISIAAYGASSRSLAAMDAGSPLRIRRALTGCTSRLGLNTNHERRVGVDSLADIINISIKCRLLT
jgi:hypothetical protein